MDAAMKDAKTQRRSSAAPAAAAQLKRSQDPVYHTDAVPSARSASSKRRSSRMLAVPSCLHLFDLPLR